MKELLALLMFLIIATSCRSYTCNNIPNSFPSSEAAIQQVKSSTFRFNDNFLLSDTSHAYTEAVESWITSANYYSCDGKEGYLIYHVTRGTDYIRTKVPIELWNGFRDTIAKGPFYDNNIKGKYPGIGIRVELNSKN